MHKAHGLTAEGTWPVHELLRTLHADDVTARMQTTPERNLPRKSTSMGGAVKMNHTWIPFKFLSNFQEFMFNKTSYIFNNVY